MASLRGKRELGRWNWVFGGVIEGVENSPPVRYESVFPRYEPVLHYQIAARRQTPAAGAECRVQNPAVLDLGQVDDAVGLHLDVVRVQACLQDRRGLGREGDCAEPVVRVRPVDRAAVTGCCCCCCCAGVVVIVAVSIWTGLGRWCVREWFAGYRWYRLSCGGSSSSGCSGGLCI